MNITTFLPNIGNFCPISNSRRKSLDIAEFGSGKDCIP
jgi:hypothetical protein